MTAELQLELLGGLRITQHSAALTTFASSKAPALLCYLAVTGRPHFRAALARLLWSDHAEEDARRNLRVVLNNLRKQVAPHLVITRDTVAFNCNSAYWLDVEVFLRDVEASTATPDLSRLRAAVDLYQGDFLEGFYVRDAP
jgi:DNA-binding SARP family transcriptional activator